MDKPALKDQERKFISYKQETDSIRNNWYIIVDNKNPELFT